MSEVPSGSAFADLGGRARMRRMHDQVDELLAGHDQMERLLQVISDIGSDLSLDATLHRIATAATEVTRARYGALAVRAHDGTLLSFVHAGMDGDAVRLIGHPPVGKGMLGVPIDDAALRLDDLTAHPASVGFPEHHPPMKAFVGVPITIRGVAFGTLYVTDDAPARTFSDADEVAVRALASAAATAIENAQLFERVQISARWTEASREITAAVLGGGRPAVPAMQLIAERARELTDAEQAIVLVPADDDVPDDEVDTLVVDTAVGVHAEEVLGQRILVDESTSGEVFRSGTPLITALPDEPQGEAVAYSTDGRQLLTLSDQRTGTTDIRAYPIAPTPPPVATVAPTGRAGSVPTAARNVRFVELAAGRTRQHPPVPPPHR